MARLVCPMCRKALPDGDTHCPRCKLRIAALPRRKDLLAEAGAAGALTDPKPPLTVRAALLLRLTNGVVLVGLAALIAFLITHGSAFPTALSNTTFFTGGITITIAVRLDNFRVSRLLDDVDLMRRRALSNGRRAAHDHVRLGFATATLLPLAMAIRLAAAAH